MPFSFPSSPTLNQQSTQNGRVYQWSGYAWEIVATPAALNASVITTGTFDAARLPLATTLAVGGVIVGTGLGVSSGTVSVTYGTNSTSSCRGDDSRLSDTRTPTDGSVTTAKIANDAVTYAKIQNVSATDRILGRSSVGAGDVEEISCGSFGRSLIGSADAAAGRTVLSVQPTASPAFTGTVSAAAANFTGAVSVTSPLTLTGTVAGNVRQIKMQTSGVDRWQITPSFDAETGSNAGSNFHITRWNDAGSFMGTPLYITRSTGIVNCESGLTIVSGQLLVTAGSVSAPGVAISGDTNTGIAQLSAGGADTLSFVTAGSERMRIGSTGAIGISADPVAGFPLTLFSFATSDANKATLLLNGTVGSGQSFAGIRFTHNVFSTGWAADILAVDTGNFGGILSFRTSAAGSATATPTERVRVDASGRVGIGVAPSTLLHLNSLGVLRLQTGSVTMDCTPTAGATDSFVWNTSANAAYRWSMAGTERMRIESDGKIYGYSVYDTVVGATNRDLFIDSGGLIGYVSSIRASKTGIETIDDVSWLRNLTPVSFHYRKRNEDGTYSDGADGTRDYGLIAEDVEPVAPEMCFYDMVDGEPQLRGVHYSKLITPMLRYIQQLEARIAALEERLNHA